MSIDGDSTLPPGLYEQLLTEALKHRVPREQAHLSDLTDERHGLLTLHVAAALERALRVSRLTIQQRVELCNRILDLIAATGPVGAVEPGDRVPSPTEVLSAISLPDSNSVPSVIFPRPQTPLSEDALFVNAPHEPGLAAELRTELVSADRVDLLCAFIVWSGIRTVLEPLKAIRARRVPVRIITTTYTGITDPRALDELTRIGAEVKVSYDTRSTRLHAKAWLFHRESGFSTAYIGSSNLTHTALHEGLEWNVRLSQVHSGSLLDRFRAAFESYWADDHFEAYDRRQFEEAVKTARGSATIDFTPFDVIPFEYQRAMLDTLEVERERHHRWRNLVVAATGTGKTIVAALDYRRIAAKWRGASLLFVAHRQEILQQSLQTFRHVLRDGAFGELLVGGHRPREGQHVFASVQSLANVDLESMATDAYDVIIVDEFHHAAAPTYGRLLEHFRPRLLLGLTATPERADERDILHWFGGRIAVELRLWDALDRGLLCPFQYFGVADEVDLTGLEWKRTGYDVGALSALYTANDFRTAKILQAIGDLISAPMGMRALGFCVSVEHAEYMAASFTRAGIPSRAVLGTTDPASRSASIRALRQREINAIFTVDVFNEGVDIPEVDTVLLLRPTESATVFLQQLGRGLRLAEGKSGLTVLDFIGQQRREFRFDTRFQALTGIPTGRLADAVGADFPYLPSGCFIHLDRVTRDIVLENIKHSLRYRRGQLVRELRNLGDVSLGTFLDETGRQLEDIYRGPGWMSLRREAGLPAPPEIDGDDALIRAIGRMRHIDDRERLLKYLAWLRLPVPPSVDTLTEREERLLAMLHLDLWTRSAGPTSLYESLRRLWEHKAIRSELVEVLEVLEALTDTLIVEQLATPEPLAVHARYSRDEILGALGDTSPAKPPTMREGVKNIPSANADVFFVTLQKPEKQFSPSTMYRDYAISPHEFHWESQSTTSVISKTGQRYIHHQALGRRILLFVREDQDHAFMYLGPARYLRHSGDRPIAFVWRLEHELPAQFFLEARAAS